MARQAKIGCLLSNWKSHHVFFLFWLVLIAYCPLNRHSFWFETYMGKSLYIILSKLPGVYRLLNSNILINQIDPFFKQYFHHKNQFHEVFFKYWLICNFFILCSIVSKFNQEPTWNSYIFDMVILVVALFFKIGKHKSVLFFNMIVV